MFKSLPFCASPSLRPLGLDHLTFFVVRSTRCGVLYFCIASVSDEQQNSSRQRVDGHITREQRTHRHPNNSTRGSAKAVAVDALKRSETEKHPEELREL